MTNQTTADEIEQAAKELAEIEGELRDAHGAPVVETRSLVLFADESGRELAEIADHHNDEHGTDLSRDDVSQWMHEKAREVYESDGAGDAWSMADPVVVLKD